jgi:hypothetical protein
MTKSIRLILTFLQEFRKCFSREISFKRFVGFVLAYIMSHNRMTITGIYRFLGSEDNLTNYHRFLSRSPWKSMEIAETLFELLMKFVFVLQDDEDRKGLVMLVDSTVIAKSGEKTDGVDKYYSSTLDRQQKGNEVVRLSVVFNFPGYGLMEFPFMCRLYVTEKSIINHKLKIEYLTREVIGAKMIEEVRKWTSLPILLVGDALYSTETTINPLMELPDVNLISRRRNGEKNGGVAWELPKKPEKQGKGRPRKRGPEIHFNDIPVDNFKPCCYIKRGEKHTVKVSRFDDVLIRRCKQPVTIVVILEEKGNRYVLVSTDNSLSTSRIIELYRIRFQIEFGFRDTKQHTGFGDYQVRRFGSITKHLTLSQTAYSLSKMLFVLCEDLRNRSKAIFYLEDPGRKISFSMMSLKEELRQEFFALLFGEPDKKKLNYLSLLFSNNRFSRGNFEKIPTENLKQDENAA